MENRCNTFIQSDLQDSWVGEKELVVVFVYTLRYGQSLCGGDIGVLHSAVLVDVSVKDLKG